MWKDWNFWLALITAVAAIIALFLSIWQTKISNKQQLFDRRLNRFLIAKSLLSLYKENKLLLERKREDELQWSVDQEFIWLTNNTYLEESAEAIIQPLTAPYHQSFLKKRDELKTLAIEIRLIFKGKESVLLAEFVSCYEQMLKAIYSYACFLNNIRKENEQKAMTAEEQKRLFPDTEQRKVYFRALDNLKNAYNSLTRQNAEEKIEKQVRLMQSKRR